MISEQKLIEYNHAGLIPGPEETEQAFSARASYCLDLKAQIPHMLDHELPFGPEEVHSSEEILKEGCEKADHLYDIYPTWVPLFFSNYKLSFWHGGCAWIFQQKQDSPTSAFFQLRHKFRTSKKYLGIYDRNELISHELSHVGRMLFEEPKFEEILAYGSSTSSFRRFFGPIVQSSYESTIFVLVLFFIIAMDFFSLFDGYSDLLHISFIGRLILLGMIVYGLARLCWRQRQFKACQSNLRKTLFDMHKADAVAYRLTDKEMIAFGRLLPDEIKRYAEEQKTKNLRWKTIYEAYFKNIIHPNHYDGDKFYNNPPLDRGFKMFLKWMINRKPQPWPKEIPTPPPAVPPPAVNENDLLITFVNHSTLLIQWGTTNILTDPIWSKRCSPFKLFGPKRVHPPGIRFEDLPPIHIVLVSHNHYDHMDLPTLKQLQNAHHPLFLTGLGNRDYLNKNGLENVFELDWWQETSADNLSVAFVPAQHFSMRNIFNRNKTLWGGFVLKKGSEVLYFAGDTGYTPYFEILKNHFGPPKISFLPIGAFEPRWFMEVAHMSPTDAIKAHQILGSRKSIAIHFGTFHLSDEAIDEPIKQLKEGLKAHHIPDDEFYILKPGESLKYTKEDI